MQILMVNNSKTVMRHRTSRYVDSFAFIITPSEKNVRSNLVLYPILFICKRAVLFIFNNNNNKLINKYDENILYYKELTLEIQSVWNVKTSVPQGQKERSQNHSENIRTTYIRSPTSSNNSKQ
jgi:hypothetical protein